MFRLSRFFNLGGGSTWPGHLALKLCPNLIFQLENCLDHGSIVVTGTNGKTTTTSALARILKVAGYKVIHNDTSANLLSGLASSLLVAAGWRHFKFSFKEKSIGVFEVDEGVLPRALQAFTPEVVILLNLSRDQLDRYAEVELTVTKWQRALSRVSPLPKIVYFAKDNYLKEVVASFPKEVLFPFVPSQNKTDLGVPSWVVTDRAAAKAVAKLLNIPATFIKTALANLAPVFGRGECLVIKGWKIKILLAKNPKSFNENLLFLLSAKPTLSAVFLLALNDNIPDGRDVSWIYDIETNLLSQVFKGKEIVISGRRAYEMALRLKYAGVNAGTIVVTQNLKVALKKALKLVNGKRRVEKSNELGDLIILPTYSAMLEVRKILTGKRLR